MEVSARKLDMRSAVRLINTLQERLDRGAITTTARGCLECSIAEVVLAPLSAMLNGRPDGYKCMYRRAAKCLAVIDGVKFDGAYKLGLYVRAFEMGDYIVYNVMLPVIYNIDFKRIEPVGCHYPVDLVVRVPKNVAESIYPPLTQLEGAVESALSLLTSFKTKVKRRLWHALHATLEEIYRTFGACQGGKCRAATELFNELMRDALPPGHLNLEAVELHSLKRRGSELVASGDFKIVPGLVVLRLGMAVSPDEFVLQNKDNPRILNLALDVLYAKRHKKRIQRLYRRLNTHRILILVI